MKPLFDSFWRAVAYSLHPRVLALSLLPLLVNGVLTLGLSYLFWEPALDAVRSTLDSWSLIKSALQWMSETLGGDFRTVFVQMIVSGSRKRRILVSGRVRRLVNQVDE